MATVERVRRLDNSHPHTRVVAAALRQPLPGKCTTLHHDISTINPPKAGVGFYASRRPEPGKSSRVISVALPYVGLLFLQRDSPCRTSKGPPWPHRWPWFSATSLAR